MAKNKSVMLFFLMLGLVFISGCTDQTPTPKATISLSSSSVDVVSGAQSKQVSVMVTRTDNAPGYAAFSLKFSSSDPIHAYAIDAQSPSQISSLSTNQLPNITSTGNTQPLSFRVSGLYPQGQTSPASYTVKVSLFYNGTLQQEVPLTVVVTPSKNG